MKNLVLCFDHERASSRSKTNVRALFDLLDQRDPTTQACWYHSGFGAPSESADGRPHNSLADAYLFLVERFEPGDRVFVFGAGCGAYCARALSRLLDIAGVLPADSEVLDYALAHWVLPHTHRTAEDWARLGRLAGELTGAVPVAVHYLGLWDTVKIPGLQRVSLDAEPMDNVADGRHAVALDEHRVPSGEYLLSEAAAEHIEEVWFRGTHADVIGGSGAPGLGRITLEWVLDGARRSGLRLRDGAGSELPSPTELEALTTSRRALAMSVLAGVRLPQLSRRPPDGASVHASVDMYLRHRPDYWRRLPARVMWADTGWPARSERLVAQSDAPRVSTTQIELAS